MNDLVKPTIITMGEPGGIGVEIALKAFLSRHEVGLKPSILLSCPNHASQIQALFFPSLSLEFISPQTPHEKITEIWEHSLPVMPLSNQVSTNLGFAEAKNAAAVIESITTGFHLVEQEYASSLVTAPIQKSSLQEAGFQFPGHTEFLESLSQKAGFKDAFSIMLLASDTLNVVPLTIHIPLKDVVQNISKERIISLTSRLYEELKLKFGINNPHIAMTGLNPHAGEDGRMGLEEKNIIIPAIKQLQSEGVNVTGPYPADTMFHKAAREQYDCALAMYHDQALIPIKTLDFDEGVNITLGLPIIRTSPDHGTALDIAEKAIARPQSMINAIKYAQKLGSGRDYLVRSAPIDLHCERTRKRWNYL